jgi:tripartite-type tricarboxylate transporter receptor subunit TctC
LDTIARLLAEKLGKILETEIIVLDKPGASGTLGTDLVVKGKKDGYTSFAIPRLSSMPRPPILRLYLMIR